MTGYYVVAPDLLGHGLYGTASDYTIENFADALLPLIQQQPPFDVIVGHSLGGLVTLALIKHLALAAVETRIHLVLVDPPLEMDSVELEGVKRAVIAEVKDVPTAEQYLRDFKLWTRRDAVLKVTAAQLCSVESVTAILDVSLQCFRL